MSGIGCRSAALRGPNCIGLVIQVSERSIVQVFERCHELKVVDIVPARWSAAQDMLLWQTVRPMESKPPFVRDYMILGPIPCCCAFLMHSLHG